MKQWSRKRKPFTWEGVTYRSKNAAAIALGVSTATIDYYEKQGYTQASDPKSHSVTWNGITYPNIDAATKATGLTASALRSRLNKGYTCDTDMPRGFLKRPVVWNGKEYESLTALAEEKGVTRENMRQHVNRGHQGDADVTPQVYSSLNELTITTGIQPPDELIADRWQDIDNALESLANGEWMQVAGINRKLMNNLRVHIHQWGKKQGVKCVTRYYSDERILYIQRTSLPRRARVKVRPFPNGHESEAPDA